METSRERNWRTRYSCTPLQDLHDLLHNVYKQNMFQHNACFAHVLLQIKQLTHTNHCLDKEVHSLKVERGELESKMRTMVEWERLEEFKRKHKVRTSSFMPYSIHCL